MMEQSLETMLIERCAPTLAGIKPASLFRCSSSPELFHSIQHWNEKLKEHGLRMRVMKWCKQTHSCLIYVFRWDWMQKVLGERDIISFLKQEGYDFSQGMEAVIRQLSRRLCVQQDFPHEIGVFLGYPLEDVIGFIVNNGQNYACCGYWKCYGDAVQAQRTFDSYHRCSACYKRLYERGIPLIRLIAAA